MEFVYCKHARPQSAIELFSRDIMGQRLRYLKMRYDKLVNDYSVIKSFVIYSSFKLSICVNNKQTKSRYEANLLATVVSTVYHENQFQDNTERNKKSSVYLTISGMILPAN